MRTAFHWQQVSEVMRQAAMTASHQHCAELVPMQACVIFAAVVALGAGMWADSMTSQFPACPVPPRIVPVPSTLPADTQTALAAVEAKLQRIFAACEATGGVVTIVLGDQQILSYSYGTTRASGGQNVTADTKFRLARCS